MSQQYEMIEAMAVTAVLSNDDIPARVMTVHGNLSDITLEAEQMTPAPTYIDFFNSEGWPVGTAERELDTWIFTYRGT